MSRRVAVIGAGIIGVTTAWYLRGRGLEVDVYDSRSGPAEATSAGNAGIVAPGYVTPWAAPGMPRKLAGYLFRSASPIIVRPALDPAQWRWLASWLGQCTPERYRRNRSRMQRIARLGRDCQRELREQLGIDDSLRHGYLQLFRTDADVAMNQPARAMLDEQGVRHQLLNATEARSLVPQLSPTTPLAAALHLPDDDSADCQRFCLALAEQARAAGVRFHFGTTIQSIRHDNGHVFGLVRARRQIMEPNTIDADAVVVCAGIAAPALLRPLGIRMPIYPVKGYSATVEAAPVDTAPVDTAPVESSAAESVTVRPSPVIAPRRPRLPPMAVMDETYKTALTPLGTQLRIAGTAEFGTANLKLRESALATLRQVANDWFGPDIDFGSARYWVGARPMTPDGPPLLGRTGIGGLFVNVGHGSTGWTMSCGSARAVAALVDNDDPGIDLDGLTLARLAEEGQ